MTPEEIKAKLQELIDTVGGLRIEVEAGRAQTGVLMQTIEYVSRELDVLKRHLK